MADHVGYTPGVGATIAADDVGGVLYQAIKIDVGGDGVSAPLSAANPLPIGGTFLEDTPHTTGDRGMLMLGVRQDADVSPVNADGDFQAFQFNQFGRLKVSILPGDIDSVSGSITANAQTVQIDSKRIGNAVLMASGTFAGINLAFEASLDGTSWFAVQGARTNANIIESTSGVLSATPAYAWEFGAASYSFLRVRATAFTSGTMSVVWSGGANATAPAQAIPPLATGTNSIGNIGTVATITNNVNTISKGTTTGGNLTSKILSAASTNATVVKASAGQVYGMQFVNTGAGWAFVKLYNKATAPTVGTDAVVEILGIPPGGAREVNRPIGMPFATGISLAITGAYTDADTTAVTAGQVVGSIQYT